MKSNSEPNQALGHNAAEVTDRPHPESQAGARRLSLHSTLLSVALLLVAALTIGWVQPVVLERFVGLREQDDSYTLPSPDQTLVMSLGYRAAVADLIYAHVLVSYGLHFENKRRFEYVGKYLDTINRLDPKFVQPYLYADTLLTLQPKPPRQEDYQKAREVLLRGTEALPYNQQMWFTAGQYIAYIAPPHLKDREQKKEWRLVGAKLLARACELATDNKAIPHHCLSAARLLNRAGEREAMIQMLRRTLAVNDDESIQQMALSALDKLAVERGVSLEREWLEAFNAAWAQDLNFLSKERLLLLGPRVDAFGCVGKVYSEPRCPTSWRRWSELTRSARGEALQAPGRRAPN